MPKSRNYCFVKRKELLIFILLLFLDSITFRPTDSWTGTEHLSSVSLKALDFCELASESNQIQMNLFTKQKQIHRLSGQTYGYWGRRKMGWGGEAEDGLRRGGIAREFGMDTYALLYLKCISNKVLGNAWGTLLNIMQQPKWE